MSYVSNEQSAKTADALLSAVNTMCLKTNEIADYMCVFGHRTLQQSFMGICLAFIERMAQTKDCHIDPRNEEAVKIAKIISDAIPEEYRGRRLSCI